MGISDVLYALDKARRKAAGGIRGLYEDPRGSVQQLIDTLDMSNKQVTPVAYGGELFKRPLTRDEVAEKYSGSALDSFAGGLGTVGKVARRAVPTSFELAHLQAQRNAAKPVSDGGLGLGPHNTSLERAKAMGFEPDRPLYHGSLHDIKRFDVERSDPGGFAGQGIYTTPSPWDASLNYANIKGPDVRGRISSALVSASDGEASRDYHRIFNKMYEGTISPRRAEVVLGATGAGDNLGTVYPVLVRRGNEANTSNPWRSAKIGPAEHYDEATEDYLPAPDLERWQSINDEMRMMGIDEMPQSLYELQSDGGTLGDLWNAVRKSNIESYDDMGEPLSSGGIASAAVRAAGGDTVTHPTEFGNWQLNGAGSHTIALRPELVRSRFAAFDPARINENDMLGRIDPLLLGLMGGGSLLGLGGYELKRDR